ncbi:MAG: alpha/beta hydrolase, partial [Planctomycetia bacterium]|nr:alpha/beta hydrolase [Planctomycetia bacterium]
MNSNGIESSGGGASPTVAAAPKPSEYRTKTTYEFEADTVTGNLERPTESDFDRFQRVTSGPKLKAIAPPAFAESAQFGAAADLEAFKRQQEAEERRRQILAEVEERASVMGAFGTNGIGADQQPNSLSGLGDRTNPLRDDAGPADLPPPGAGNPLRESRVGAMAPSAVFPRSPAPGRPGSNPAPALDAADDVERFARIVPAPAGGTSIQPGQTRATASASSSPTTTIAAPSSDDDPYEVVQVFYGTDRQSAEPPPGDWPHVVRCFWPTVSVGLITVCLALLAVGRRSLLLGSMAAVCAAITIGLGYEDTTEALALVRGAGKQGPCYTTERAAGGHVELGRCEVTVPFRHRAGEVESPSVLRLEIAENAAEHLILHKTERLADAAFYEHLRQTVSQSVHREVFVFIHGFNVSFEDAARRTAQIHYDLKFDGAPIFFSWPAHDRFILTYAADENNIAWSTPHFKQFLLEIVKESGARSINLIAHSMGNRALAAALREIELELHQQARLFNQVILAAPDIDADDFRNNIAPAMQRTAQRLTLYASAHDEALLASQFIHHGPRAGDAGDGLIVVPGVDTIDVTPIDRSLWG